MTVILVAIGAVAVLFTVLSLALRRPWPIVPAGGLLVVALVLAFLASSSAATPVEAVLVAAVFGAVGVLGGSAIVALVLKLAQSGVELGDHGGIVVDADAETAAPGKRRAAQKEVLRGGATVGFLERLALIGAVLAGQPAAIAIIVAVKGLGRFTELDDSEARERFIIGTLTSLIWAGLAVGVILLVVTP